MDRQSLAHFRKILKEQCDAVHLRLVGSREYGRVQNQSEVTDEGDRASAQVDRETSAVQQTQGADFLTALNEALDRIDAGTFGACLSCGQEISPNRLAAVPWTQHCITCQELANGG